MCFYIFYSWFTQTRLVYNIEIVSFKHSFKKLLGEINSFPLLKCCSAKRHNKLRPIDCFNDIKAGQFRKSF